MTEKYKDFMAYLQDRLEGSQYGSAMRAQLRRSLSSPPAQSFDIYYIVEPFLNRFENNTTWSRQCHYLVAGLWAMNRQVDETGQGINLGEAAGRHARTLGDGKDSFERRFLNLLDADEERFFHYLRQMMAILNEYTIDFDDCLKQMRYWHAKGKSSQQKWAKAFYKELYRKEEAKEEVES